MNEFRKMEIKQKCFEGLLSHEHQLCALCAAEHGRAEPHRYDTYYIVRFEMTHGRLPTWLDSCAHLSQQYIDIMKKIVTDSGSKWTETDEPISEPYQRQR